MSNTSGIYYVYIGTYTTGKSEGIYSFKFDPSSGSLEPLGVAAKIGTPAYLAVSRDNSLLYSIADSGLIDGKPAGAVAAFKIDKVTGALELLNQQPANSLVSCHINVDASNKYLFAANYKQGLLSVFPLKSDGSIGPILNTIHHQGTGANPERQEMPHTHFVSVTPEGKYLCAVDLGIDRIMAYELNMSNGALTFSESLTAAIEPGRGPRHMVFHPNRKFAYVVNELISSVAAMEYDSAKPGFKQLQYISTLPESFDGQSACAAIKISADGRFLYASNRGHDSIAIFSIDQNTGRLTPVDYASTLGKHPRDFEIDPTGKFLVATNMDSDSLILFSIDGESGRIKPTGTVFEVPDPICVKFVKA